MSMSRKRKLRQISADDTVDPPFTVQKTTCKRTPGWPSCYSCADRSNKKGKGCVFKDCRVLETTKTPLGHLFFPHDEWQLHFKEALNRKITREDILEMMTTIANVLLPVLQEERLHREQPKATRKYRKQLQTDTCDVCRTQLFHSSFTCMRCGRDLCWHCKINTVQHNIPLSAVYEPCSVGSHPSDALLPVSFFDEEVLESAIRRMKELVPTISPLVPLAQEDVELPQEAPVLKQSQSDFLCSFNSSWSQGIPVVVVESLSEITLERIDKDYFSRCYGDHIVRRIDCRQERTDEKVTLREFLSQFGATRQDEDTIWKLKDWPPSQDLEVELRELHAQIELTVPVPDITRADGVKNFASYFAVNANKPDLGPKMYLAYAGTVQGHHIASTCLHKDFTAAYNIALDVARLPNGEPGYALWTIWPAWSSPMLEQFIFDEGLASPADGNPIHGQRVYIDEARVDVFSHRYNIKPFVIRQYKGDTVFVPSNAPHQVSNRTDCIKYARDFLCSTQLAEVFQVQNELREHRLNYEGVDVLQPHQMLWFGWISLCDRFQRLKVLSTQPEAPISERSDQNTTTAPALAASSHTKLPDGKTKHNRLVRSQKAYRETYIQSTICMAGDGRNFRCPLVPPDYERHGYQRVHCASWQTRNGLLDHLSMAHADSIQNPWNDKKTRRSLLKIDGDSLFYETIWQRVALADRYHQEHPHLSLVVFAGQDIPGRLQAV